MTTLFSSVIRLHALNGGALRHDAGQWANAAFYGILHQVDPLLAEALHQWNGRKPFTISSLNGLPRGDGREVVIPPGWECWLRVTTLGQEIFQPFIQRFIQGGARPQLQLGPIDFGVAEVLTVPGSHPWSGYVESEQLLAQADAAERIELLFASPTAFNVGPRYELVPLPRLVFGQLASKWNAFLPQAIGRESVEAVADEAVMISDFRLQTRTQQWKGRVQKGFTGECVYDLSALGEGERRLFALLADFAFYAGVGGKTTQGMGQARRVVGSSPG